MGKEVGIWFVRRIGESTMEVHQGLSGMADDLAGVVPPSRVPWALNHRADRVERGPSVEGLAGHDGETNDTAESSKKSGKYKKQSHPPAVHC